MVSLRARHHAHEIDVDGALADRVELVVARDGADLLAGDVDRGDRGEETATVNLEVDLAVGKRDRDRGFLAAIDYGGNHALTTG